MGAGEQVRQVEHGHDRGRARARSRSRWVGAGAPHGHGQAGRVEDRAGVAARPARRGSPTASGPAQRVEDLLLAAAEELGQHPVDHHGGQLDRGLLPHPLGQLDGLVDRHLLGRGTRPPGRSGRGSERMSSIQSVWLRIRPTLTRSLMACGAASWPTMWPDGRGVDHDQVVVALAHLVAELADGQDLPHARARRWPRSRTPWPAGRCGRRPGCCSWSLRYSRSDASVSIDMATRARAGSRGPSKPVGGVSKKPATSPLASTSQTSTRLPRLGGQQGQGRRRPSSCRRRPCR